ncbi:MAG: flap endonuclease-1 [Candidatus Thermoplasmatota archaeon]|nr:flap endonuclease-1 [Candidatus Thermoplasmatota archaeon]
MGVKLGDLVVKRRIGDGELSGKVIGMDAYNILYQFVSSIRTPEGFPLTDSGGNIVSHLKGLFSRTASLMSEGVSPIYIFDGRPHELKRGTLELRRARKEKAVMEWEKALEEGDLQTARTKASQTSRLTDEMIDDAKHLLGLMGVPCVQAPGEGEAQASYMASKGDVYGASSQDFDSILFGCPLLIRNLAVTGRRKLPGKREWIDVQPEIIDLKRTLSELGLTREQLIDLAILVGTDFNEGVKGIGPKRALSMIREFGTLERAAKEKRIPLLEWDKVREIFLDPCVTDEYSIEYGELKRDMVMGFLVDNREFGPSGVERTLDQIGARKKEVPQSSLDAFL